MPSWKKTIGIVHIAIYGIKTNDWFVSLIIKWCRWFLSGSKGDFLLISLSNETLIVSKQGNNVKITISSNFKKSLLYWSINIILKIIDKKLTPVFPINNFPNRFGIMVKIKLKRMTI